jgi:hypothetical protein
MVILGTLCGSNDRFAKWFARLGLDGLTPVPRFTVRKNQRSLNKETIPIWWYCDLNVWDDDIAPFTDSTQWINAHHAMAE